MLFAILRHLPCTDYMKWNKGELYYHRVWFTMVEDDVCYLNCIMCRCKDWLNINLVRSYNTALLKEMRCLVSQTVLSLSCLYMYFNQGKGLASCEVLKPHSISLDGLHVLQCTSLHMILQAAKRGRAYVALRSPSLTYCK